MTGPTDPGGYVPPSLEDTSLFLVEHLTQLIEGFGAAGVQRTLERLVEAMQVPPPEMTVGSVWDGGPNGHATIIEKPTRYDGEMKVRFVRSTGEVALWHLALFLSRFKLASVIVKPTAEGWIRLGDEDPGDLKVCWWWDPKWGGGRPALGTKIGTGIEDPDMLWQPLPIALLPPAPSGVRPMNPIPDHVECCERSTEGRQV